MAILEKNLRNDLNAAIVKAREIAENAARKSISGLAVGEIKPFDYMSDEQKAFRRLLRAHGREIGDIRNGDGSQETDVLVEECAYEHWNCMLFSRFLAENSLLMHPELSVAVSMVECEDLAKEEGYANKWECAIAYASKMLPMIFKEESPSLKLEFSSADMQALEEIIEDLDDEVFHASDSIGWCYQFWQEKRKKDINSSEVKIGERELSPVTQLFTEPYMVSFLLDNSLGAWFASKRLAEADYKSASSEEELREKASIPGVPLEYLRFSREKDGMWRLGAGDFEKWPDSLADFSMLDPCCGSGHFLVATFNMLVPMRMYLEGMSASEACKAVLEQNIHGLELDGRCVELAVFALAFAAWTCPDAGGWRELPELRIACCGKSIHLTRAEWSNFVRKEIEDTNTRLVMSSIYDVFEKAPVLGSLISPSDMAEQMGILCSSEQFWESFRKITSVLDDDSREAGISARGIISSAELLLDTYDWVVTNPPYLGTGKLEAYARNYIAEKFSDSDSNLATVFIERCIQLAKNNGFCSMVVPNQFLFTIRYKELREKLLTENSLVHVIDLGARAFEQISGEIVKAVLLGIKKKQDESQHSYFALSCPEKMKYEDKHVYIKDEAICEIRYDDCKDDKSKIIFVEGAVGAFKPLSEYVDSSGGCSSFDAPQYYFFFWEFPKREEGYIYSQTAPENNICASGLNYYFNWQDGRGKLAHFMSEKKRLENYSTGVWTVWSRLMGKRGICLSMIKLLPTYYYGGGYDNNTTVLIPSNEDELDALWCYCSSPDYFENVRKIDRSLKVTNATLTKVPYDVEHWKAVAAKEYPNGLPAPFCNDPTQWAFHGHPCDIVSFDENTRKTAYGEKRVDDMVLQVAVCRLLGFRWPAEYDECMELDTLQREVVKRSGRELNAFSDEDGIVCIPAIGKESGASDRVVRLLAAAYGDQWSTMLLERLITASGYAGKDLEEYLRTGFFKEHCKLFGNRPFIWHIWDGLNDGFSAFVNYHKLDDRLLSKLIYTVLGDWIQLQKDNYNANVDGAKRKLDAAISLQKKLISILEGDAPFDIFVRWKNINEQSIGWKPDINDGVRMNIRPFVEAGVLKEKFNINWKKDRGKDVSSSPWFSEFNGERINDKHLTLVEKKAAQENRNT